MKVYDAKDIRNIALLGHAASGKTTLAEAVLYTSGVISRMGRIDDGNTRSDYLDDEISRRNSISSALLQTEWQGTKFNIIDTPGYADFIGEIICGIQSVDVSLICVDAINGLDVGTETAWEMTEKYDRPCIFVVTRAGKEHAKAETVASAVTERFGIRALPVQIAVNSGIGFNSIVDIISMKEYTYELDGKGVGKGKDISDGYADTAAEMHEKLIEAAAESDDSLMEKFFDAGLTPEEVAAGIKAAILNRTLIPIVFTDGYSNVGTDLFLRLIAGSAPSPADMPPLTVGKGKETVELVPVNSAPLAMQVFKTVVETHVGELSLFRVYSGSYKSGDELYNVTRSTSERPTLIYTMRGKDRDEIGAVNAGDMGAFVKMKVTRTGDSLGVKSNPVSLPKLEYPEPVMDVAVYPVTKGDEDKVSQGLQRLNDEDPSFRVRTDPELKQIILEGQGGMHIDVIIDRFKHKNNMDVVLKPPKIPYRETITGKADEKYRYKKQTGGRGQYGDVSFRMEPLPRGSGFEFADEIKGGVVPARFIPAVEKGIVETMHEGPLTKSKVIDLKVALYYGSYHTVDSSEQAFKTAASMCFKECFLKAHPIILEPIYTIEVKVPDDYTGDVMGDLSSRRGKIMGMEPSGVFQMVKALVPLAELYQYSTHLRSLTHGRGAYRRSFSHYEQVPPDIAQKVIEKTKAVEEEE